MSNKVKLPLTYTEIVDEIARFTALPREEVEHRVWMQALQPGWNVLQDVARFGVTPHLNNDKMNQLYEQGIGFIFETLVYWAKPERYRWTEQTLERIRLYLTRKGMLADDVSILIFGDGTGNDSLYLASQGFKVDYFDVPGSKTYEFAMKRFDSYGFLNRFIRPLPDYQACFTRLYDVVITFEVLEHLPEPLTTIQDISTILQTGGIALITEDFDDIVPRLPTHLKANVQYFGKTPFLFLKNKMRLSWYSQEALFKPMEFVKLDRVSTEDWLFLIRDYNVRSIYLSRYTGRLARFIEKLAYYRFMKR
jgi:2-polyprenyl-3-methyl-5-hydroxy-6-metoxy-1,4-benzoquinol methylase